VNNQHAVCFCEYFIDEPTKIQKYLLTCCGFILPYIRQPLKFCCVVSERLFAITLVSFFYSLSNNSELSPLSSNSSSSSSSFLYMFKLFGLDFVALSFSFVSGS
jgi:hypothetical protein